VIRQFFRSSPWIHHPSWHRFFSCRPTSQVASWARCSPWLGQVPVLPPEKCIVISGTFLVLIIPCLLDRVSKCCLSSKITFTSWQASSWAASAFLSSLQRTDEFPEALNDLSSINKPWSLFQVSRLQPSPTPFFLEASEPKRVDIWPWKKVGWGTSQTSQSAALRSSIDFRFAPWLMDSKASGLKTVPKSSQSSSQLNLWLENPPYTYVKKSHLLHTSSSLSWLATVRSLTKWIWPVVAIHSGFLFLAQFCLSSCL